MYIEEKKFEIPSAGSHNAVFVDYLDLGSVASPWGPKDTVKPIFLLDQPAEDGHPMQFHVLCSKSIGTAGRPSKLRKIISALISPKPVPKGVELNNYIGRNCVLHIVHVTKDGKTFANMEAATPADPNAPWLGTDSYRRPASAMPPATPTPQPAPGHRAPVEGRGSFETGAAGTPLR